MIIHQFKSLEALEVHIGIPGSLRISSTPDQPQVTMQFPSCDPDRLDLNITENNHQARIFLEDRFNKSNGAMYADTKITLPESLLESLKINTICSNMSIGPVSVNSVEIHNVKGKIEILPDTHIRNLKLTLVESKASVNISNDIERAHFKAIQCNMLLKTSGFQGGIDIDIVGAKAGANNMMFQNGHWVFGDKNNHRIACEVIGGIFDINQQ